MQSTYNEVDNWSFIPPQDNKFETRYNYDTPSQKIVIDVSNLSRNQIKLIEETFNKIIQMNGDEKYNIFIRKHESSMEDDDDHVSYSSGDNDDAVENDDDGGGGGGGGQNYEKMRSPPQAKSHQMKQVHKSQPSTGNNIAEKTSNNSNEDSTDVYENRSVCLKIREGSFRDKTFIRNMIDQIESANEIESLMVLNERTLFMNFKTGFYGSKFQEQKSLEVNTKTVQIYGAKSRQPPAEVIDIIEAKFNGNDVNRTIFMGFGNKQFTQSQIVSALNVFDSNEPISIKMIKKDFQHGKTNYSVFIEMYSILDAHKLIQNKDSIIEVLRINPHFFKIGYSFKK